MQRVAPSPSVWKSTWKSTTASPRRSCRTDSAHCMRGSRSTGPPHHRPTHSSPPRRTNADRLGSSTLSPADLNLQPEEYRKAMELEGRPIIFERYQYDL